MPKSKRKRSGAKSGGGGSLAIPLWKKALYGLFVTGAALALVEAAAFGLRHAMGFTKKNEVAVWNTDDPEKREVVMPAEVGREAVASLDETLRFNMFNNRTTRPDPRYMFRVRPGLDNDPKTRGAINSLGFRGREFDFDDHASMRILLFGDSCPFGWEILETEKTIAFVLESVLEREGVPVQVFNLGQPGFSTYQASLMFDDWFDRLAPDYVIYYGGWNDLRKADLTDAQMHRVLRWTMSPSTGFLRSSNSYRLFTALATKARWAEAKEKARMGDRRRRVSSEDAIALLARMEDRARDAGSDFLMVLPPFSAERAPGTPESLERMLAYRGELTSALEDRLVLLRFEQMEYDRADSPRYFLDIDGYHPNAEGAQIIGRGISRAILSMGERKGKSAGGR